MNWREYPMARLLLPFAGGIGAGVKMEGMPYQVWPVLALSFALLAFRQKGRLPYGRRWWYGAALFIFLFCIGLLLAHIQDERRRPGHFSGLLPLETEQLLIGRIENLEPSGQRLKARLRVLAVAESGGGPARRASGNLLAYIGITADSRTLSAGDVALLRARVLPVAPPLNPKAFDYGRYLHFQNIHYQAFVAEGAWRQVAHRPGLQSYASRLRAHCVGVLRNFLPTENEFAVAAALVLGYKAELPDEVRNAYADTGAMHVLAVSGLHVGFIQMIAASLLGLFPFSGRAWPPARSLILLCCIWGFALLTGASPSVLRAAGMFSFLALGQAFRWHANVYNTLAASAFCLLCANPFLLFSPGFQLSYLAVLGIVYFQPRIYKCWYVENKAGDYLWKLVAVSLAAQLTTFPLSLYYFHQFPAYFWLSGLVVVPAAGLILPAGLALFALHAVPWLGWLAGQALYWLVWSVNALIFLIRQLPGGLLEGVWIGGLSLALLYLAIGCFTAALHNRNFRWLLGGLLALLLLAVSYSGRCWQWRNQRALAIYHIRGGTAIDLFDGRNGAQLLGRGLEAESLRYAAQQHRWYRGLADLQAFHLPASAQGRNWRTDGLFLQFGARRLAIVQDERLMQGAGRLPVDAVLLCNNAGLSIAELMEKLDFRLAVIDGSNSYRRVQAWLKECRERGIGCHYTGADGAWVVE